MIQKVKSHFNQRRSKKSSQGLGIEDNQAGTDIDLGGAETSLKSLDNEEQKVEDD